MAKKIIKEASLWSTIQCDPLPGLETHTYVAYKD